VIEGVAIRTATEDTREGHDLALEVREIEQVEHVLENPAHAAVIFGSDQENSVAFLDLPPQPTHIGVIRIQVVPVSATKGKCEGTQVQDADLCTLPTHQLGRLTQHLVRSRTLAQAARDAHDLGRSALPALNVAHGRPRTMAPTGQQSSASSTRVRSRSVAGWRQT
jgi:hypothetical protein